MDVSAWDTSENVYIGAKQLERTFEEFWFSLTFSDFVLNWKIKTTNNQTKNQTRPKPNQTTKPITQTHTKPSKKAQKTQTKNVQTPKTLQWHGEMEKRKKITSNAVHHPSSHSLKLQKLRHDRLVLLSKSWLTSSNCRWPYVRRFTKSENRFIFWLNIRA